MPPIIDHKPMIVVIGALVCFFLSVQDKHASYYTTAISNHISLMADSHIISIAKVSGYWPLLCPTNRFLRVAYPSVHRHDLDRVVNLMTYVQEKRNTDE